jgi:hypothetical protein
MLFDLSYIAYLPSVVERDELGEGNSSHGSGVPSVRPDGRGSSGRGDAVTANVLLGLALNYLVTVISLNQAITPDHLLGRTNAPRRFLVQGVSPSAHSFAGRSASARSTSWRPRASVSYRVWGTLEWG